MTPNGTSLIRFLHDHAESTDRGTIVEQNIASGAVRLIGETNPHPWDPTFSPDGSQLAYFDRDPADSEKLADLEIMSIEDGSTRIIYPGSQKPAIAFEAGINWSPDGKNLLLAFLNEERTQHQFHLLDPVSGERTPVGQSMKEGQVIRHAALHPDGKQLAFSSGEIGSQLWAIKNLIADK